MGTWIVLLIVALSAAHLLKGFLRKGCASGCGSCGAKSCALRNLEARLKAETSRKP